MKIKSLECLKSIRNYEKIMLGTSMSPLSQLATEQAYYIVDCRISSHAELQNEQWCLL